MAQALPKGDARSRFIKMKGFTSMCPNLKEGVGVGVEVVIVYTLSQRI